MVVRVRLPPIIPGWLVVILFLTFAAASAIAAALQRSTGAGGWIFLGILILSLHFTPLGWLEFSADRRTVRFVSSVRRHFTIKSWPVTLGVPESVTLSPGAEFLICREEPFGALQFSVRVHKPDGTEHVIWRPLLAFNYKQAVILARSIEQCAGFPSRLLQRRQDATGEHEQTWDGEADRRLHRAMFYYAPAGLMPYSGFAMRAITSNAAVITLGGVGMWFCAAMLMARGMKADPRPNTDEPHWVVSVVLTLMFALIYVISVLIADALKK